MLVLHEIAWCCFLLQDGPDFYLDVLCNHSAANYGFLLHMDDAEVAAYREQGIPYLQRLADAIQYSAPGVMGSRSAFLQRRASADVQGRVHAAIQAFRDRSHPSG